MLANWNEPLPLPIVPNSSKPPCVHIIEVRLGKVWFFWRMFFKSYREEPLVKEGLMIRNKSEAQLNYSPQTENI